MTPVDGGQWPTATVCCCFWGTTMVHMRVPETGRHHRGAHPQAGQLTWDPCGFPMRAWDWRGSGHW
jgi:hypothetical protein